MKNLESESEKLKTLLKDDDEDKNDDEGERESLKKRNERARKSADAMEEWLEQQDIDQPPTLQELALTELLNRAWQFTDPVDMATTLESLDMATRAATISPEEVETAEQEKEKHEANAQIGPLQAWSHAATYTLETFQVWFTRLYEGSSSVVFAALNWLRHHVVETACKTVWKFAKDIVLSAVDGFVTYVSIKVLSESIATMFNGAFNVGKTITVFGSFFIGLFTARFATFFTALFATIV